MPAIGVGVGVGFMRRGGGTPTPTPSPFAFESGVHTGNTQIGLDSYDRWLGRDADTVQVHSGRADEADYTGSVGWLANSAAQFGTETRPIRWSIPMFWQTLGADATARFTAALAGDCDAAWTSVANTLATRHPTGDINVRTGWEFNGNWQEWQAAGNEANFAATWQRMHGIFKGVSSRFRFDWCPNIGVEGMSQATIEASYPGDAYVDVISIDFYHKSEYGDSTDPATAWNEMLTKTCGINWASAFASARSKPLAFAEWGVKSSGFGPYISAAKAYMDAHANFEYHCYWSSASDYDSIMSLGQYIDTGTTFREQFGVLSSPSADAITDLYPDYDLAFDPVNGFYKVDTFITDSLTKFLSHPAVYYYDPALAGYFAPDGFTPTANAQLKVALDPANSWTMYVEGIPNAYTSGVYEVFSCLTNSDDDSDALIITRDGYANELRANARQNGNPLGTDTNIGWLAAGSSIRAAAILDAVSARFFNHGSLQHSNAAANALSSQGLDMINIGDRGTISTNWPNKITLVLARRAANQDSDAVTWTGGGTEVPAPAPEVTDLYPAYDFAFDPVNSFYKVGSSMTNDLATFLGYAEVDYAADPTSKISASGYLPSNAEDLTVTMAPSATWTVYAEGVVPNSDNVSYNNIASLGKSSTPNTYVTMTRESYSYNIRSGVKNAGNTIGSDFNFDSVVAHTTDRFAFVGDASGVRFYSDNALGYDNTASPSFMANAMLDRIWIGDRSGSQSWANYDTGAAYVKRILAKRSADSAGAQAWTA